MNGTNWRRVAVAAALVLGVSAAAAGTTSAGVTVEGNLLVDITVRGVDPVDVLDGLVIEVWNEDPADTFTQVPPVVCDTPAPDVSGLPWTAQADYTCTFEAQTSPFYAIGLDGIPEHYQVSGSCVGESIPGERLDLGGAENFIYTQSPAVCTLVLEAPVLIVDKVVVGGDAASSDFTLQVLDGQGDPVTTVTDVADATCEADYDVANCGAVVVPPGVEFQFAEPNVENYELTGFECETSVDVENPPSQGELLVGDDTYCVVTNTYVPPTTTTTTTTTLAPTTTAPAVTTTIDAGVVTLPQTGSSSSTNTALAAVAALLVVLGGALLAVRRQA